MLRICVDTDWALYQNGTYLGIIDVQYDAMEWVKFTISYNFPLQSQKSILGEIIWKVKFKKQ